MNHGINKEIGLICLLKLIWKIIMIEFSELKKIVEMWINDDEWDTLDHSENKYYSEMINSFKEKGVDNIETDDIIEILVDKLRDKYHNYGEDEVMGEVYEHIAVIDEDLYSINKEED